MKKSFSILLLAITCLVANAQFVSGPSKFSMVTNAGTLVLMPSIVGAPATNFPNAQVPWVTVGANGFAVWVRSFGTNAAMTTNVVFDLECSSDGVNPNTNMNIAIVVPPKGTTTNTFHTNIVTQTSATLGNLAAVRLRSFANTNGLFGGASVAGALFVERIAVNTR